MPEPLTLQLVTTLLRELHVAFPRTIGMNDSTAVADVYRNGLRGLSGDAVRVAVRRVIEEDSYFPKVARLRELAQGWTRSQHESARTPQLPADPDACPICGAKPEHFEVTRWRRGKDKPYPYILDEDGRRIQETVVSLGRRVLHDARKHGLTAVHHDGG